MLENISTKLTYAFFASLRSLQIEGVKNDLIKVEIPITTYH